MISCRKNSALQLLLVLSFFATSVVAYKNITILSVLSWVPGGQNSEFVDQISILYNYLEDWMVSNDELIQIGDEKVGLQYRIENGMDNQTLINQIYEDALNDPSISLFVGPKSGQSDPIIEMMENERRLLMSVGNLFNTKLSNSSYALSVGLSTDTSFFTSLPVLRVAGVKTITLIYGETDDILSVRCKSETFRYELRVQGFEIVSEHALKDPDILFAFTRKNYTDYPLDVQKNITDTALLAMKYDADAWLSCALLVDSTGLILETLRGEDYTPRYFGLTEAIDEILTFDQDNWQYVSAGTQYNPNMEFGAARTLGMFNDFRDDIEALSGVPLKAQAPAYAAMFVMFKTAIENVISQQRNRAPVLLDSNSALKLGGNSTCPCASNNIYDLLYDTIFQFKIDTISGRYSWDSNRLQQREWLYMQIQHEGNFTLIGPPATKRADLIYPMPKWHERVFDPHYGHWTEILVSLVAIILLCVSIGWAVFLVVNLAQPKVKASSPLFMGLMLIGSALVYLSVFSLLPNVVSTFTCTFMPWILDLGFILLFGPLFAKTLRIDRLYSNKSADIFMISDKMVLLWVGILVIGHIILLTILTAVGRSEKHLVVVDPILVYQNYYTCTASVAYKAILYTICASNGILLLVCSVVAFRVRAIPIKRFNESKIIFFAVYNVTFFAFLSFALAAANIDRFIKFALVAIFILFGAGITVNSFFLHKTQAGKFMDSVGSTKIFSGSINTNTSSVKAQVE